MITLAEFLDQFGNLQLRVVHHRAPYIFEATCIAKVPSRPNDDHHAIAVTPDEAIDNLAMYMDLLTVPAQAEL